LRSGHASVEKYSVVQLFITGTRQGLFPAKSLSIPSAKDRPLPWKRLQRRGKEGRWEALYKKARPFFTRQRPGLCLRDCASRVATGHNVGL